MVLEKAKVHRKMAAAEGGVRKVFNSVFLLAALKVAA